MSVPTSINLIGPFLQLFFAEHLVVHKRASAQTIARTATHSACCYNSYKAKPEFRRQHFRSRRLTLIAS